jgi:hypothetical protein
MGGEVVVMCVNKSGRVALMVAIKLYGFVSDFVLCDCIIKPTFEQYDPTKREQ